MIFKMPDDDWGPVTPRAWQHEALPTIIAEYSKPKPDSCIVRAVTRSGKSKLMAQMAACAHLEPNEVIVVSTSTVYLVKQLEQTFRERLEASSFNLGENAVGTYYTHGKNTTAKVIITCTPSVPELAKRLMDSGRKTALWIPDEAHRTRTATIMNAQSTLQPAASCGFTATAFRSKETESLNLFQRLIINYTPKRALEDGVVVPFRPVFWSGGDGELDDVCIEMTALAKGPGLFNATSISDAEVFCMKLIDNGIAAKAIHSKLPDKEQEVRINELKSGEIAALVHVSMLQEGCDFPWLRWICLRRPCGSRVRFIQELGRIISSYTDPVTGEKKEEAVVYDPHCLLQDFKIDYEAVLAGDVDPEDEEEIADPKQKDSEKKARQFEQMIFELMKEIVNANAGKKPLSLTPLAAYLCELVNTFDMCGLIDRKVKNREWRRKETSEKQMSTVKTFLNVLDKRSVPKNHQRPLKLLAEPATMRQMNRGMVSDLISLMMSLANNKKWPDLKILDRSAADSMRAHEKRKSDLVKKPITTPVITMTTKPSPVQKKDEPSLFE